MKKSKDKDKTIVKIITKDDLFQDEIGNFEYDMCVNDALRHVKQRFQESDLIINT